MDKSSIFYLISGLISITGVYIAMNSKALGSIHEYVPINKMARQLLLPMTIAILGIVLMLLSLKLDKVEDISVTDQISEIENMEKSIKNLSLFLEYKKSEIFKTSELINELKDEHAIFDSIAKVDERTIENVLAIQQRANQRNKWKEWGIAFVLGVISSIIGGRILERIKK
jgi:hypothetical protein